MLFSFQNVSILTATAKRPMKYYLWNAAFVILRLITTIIEDGKLLLLTCCAHYVSLCTFLPRKEAVTALFAGGSKKQLVTIMQYQNISCAMFPCLSANNLVHDNFCWASNAHKAQNLNISKGAFHYECFSQTHLVVITHWFCTKPNTSVIEKQVHYCSFG